MTAERSFGHPPRRAYQAPWMAHSHIAEHHESGMMFSFDVDPADVDPADVPETGA